jgi:lactate permease
MKRPLNPAAATIGTYGALTVLMAAITMVGPLRVWTQSLAWKPAFPGVTSRAHFSTPPGPGQVFRPLAHPGALILAVAALSVGLSALREPGAAAAAKKAARATWRSAATATVGVISMVGLSTLMDHCEMSRLLARGLSNLLGALYPVVSPCVGILGAFATGSNNNSNVLFGSLQKNVALLQHLNPCILVAAQTAGGSLGSMLAPVKLILGCSTVGLLGQEGRVMRQTVPCGLALGLALGLLTLLLCR